jgi:predicted NBD/HSP70 family sugar kinase
MSATGVDIGGTFPRVALRHGGEPPLRWAWEQSETPLAEWDRVVEVLSAHHPAHLGISLAGRWGRAGRPAFMPHHTAWEGAPWDAWAKALTGHLPRYLWDAHATPWGAADGPPEGAVLIVGTGLAAAMADQGRVVEGGGLAGVVGWWDIGPGGMNWEAACSGSGLFAQYGAPADVLLAAARRGDPAASALLVKTRRTMVRGVAMMVQAYHPSRIWLAGSVALSGCYDEAVQEGIAAAKPGLGPIPVAKVPNGDWAAALGALRAAHPQCEEGETVGP